MNVQLRKELWGLRWAWLVGLLVAVVPLLPLPGTFGGYPEAIGLWVWLFFAVCVVFGVEVFGQEFAGGGFSQLLAQPVSRAGIWKRKMTATGIGLAVVSVLFVVLSAVRIESSLRFSGGLISLETPSLVGWLATCGAVLVAGVGAALWLSIHVRQSAAVFWLSLLVPPSVFGLTSGVMDRLPGVSQGDALAWAFGLVAVLGGLAWWGAYRAFVRAEDVPPLAREFHLPWLSRSTAGSRGGWGWLWRKEVRLHQFSMVVTMLTVGMVVLLLILHWLAPGESSEMLLFVVLLLWLLTPVFVGACAVAEERRMGTAGVWRMLPVSRARLWWTKVAAAMGMALVLGAVIPWMGNGVACRLLFDNLQDAPVIAWWVWGLFWVGGCSLGLYASSLSRHVVGALSVAALVVGGLVAVLRGLSELHGADLRLFWLGLSAAGLLLLPAMWTLAFVNGMRVEVDRRLVRTNVVVLSVGLLLTGVLAFGLHHRAWEMVVTAPSSPGVPLTPVAGVRSHVQTMESGPAFVGDETESAATVLTPDGRLWFCYQEGDGRDIGVMRLGDGKTFTSAGATVTRVFAVDVEGGLWTWMVELRAGELRPASVVGERVDDEGGWVAVSANVVHAVGLKRDGTLWGFGRSPNGQLGVLEASFQTGPVPMGRDRLWRLSSASYGGTLAVDSGGEVWRWGNLGGMDRDQMATMDWSKPVRLAGSNAWVRVSGRAGIGLGIGELENGSVWVFGTRKLGRGQLEAAEPRRLGHPVLGTAWVRGVDQHWVALMKDGALRRWTPPVWEAEAAESAFPLVAWLNEHEPERIGGRGDWVAISPQRLALTGDGVVWEWLEDDGRGWLAPSRWPRRVVALAEAERD